ncbi:LysR family transcriptional regulator [Ectopseudomonas mendocina]|uniref:LysR family transcriptional regulator n=1 Tax=Ectopseudomonas mendocina TaxID=300 RepID=A0ABZ2RGS2_ECTME
MRYSPESLVAFVEAAALGSFSAAARKLKKSQSTISIAIANLEADVGCELFDRSARHPVLNDAGRLVLARIEEILSASERLDALASRLSINVEPLLSVAMSDIYSLSVFGEVVAGFAQVFPDTELRCGPSEDADVIYMIQAGYAHMGILAAQPSYPPDIATVRLPYRAQFNVYVSASHPLAKLADIQPRQLQSQRQLCLKTYEPGQQHRVGQAWSAPDYLTLMEFAKRGFGWAELPVDLVDRYGAGLVVLNTQGYPHYVDLDVVWSRRSPLGPAGQWLVEHMQAATG